MQRQVNPNIDSEPITTLRLSKSNKLIQLRRGNSYFNFITQSMRKTSASIRLFNVIMHLLSMEQ